MLAPWKKSCDKPRQHIKKQRHHFASKGPSSQSYGFSSSHVWIWGWHRSCILPKSELRAITLSILLSLSFFFLRIFFFFLMWTIFSLYWICYSIASVLCFDFFVTRHAGSQLPNQWLNLHPLQWRVKSNHWTTTWLLSYMLVSSLWLI